MKAEVRVRRALLSISAMLVFAAGSVWSENPVKTMTGTITDDMCGAEHMMKNKSAAECVRVCTKAGSGYALVSNKEVYGIRGNKAELEKYAGVEVTVKGKMDDNILVIDSIESAKSSK